MKDLGELVHDTAVANSASELALGYLRYEALRKLGPAAYKELHRRNLAGERFDDMVDELVRKE